MKKTMMHIILVGWMCLCLSACPPEQESTSSETNQTQEQATKPDPVAALTNEGSEDEFTPEVKAAFIANSGLDKVGDFVDNRMRKLLGTWRKDTLHERRLTVFVFSMALSGGREVITGDEAVLEAATQAKKCFRHAEKTQLPDSAKLGDILVKCQTQGLESVLELLKTSKLNSESTPVNSKDANANRPIHTSNLRSEVKSTAQQESTGNENSAQWTLAVGARNRPYSAHMTQQGENLTGYLLDPSGKSFPLSSGAVQKTSEETWKFTFYEGESRWEGQISKQGQRYLISNGNVYHDATGKFQAEFSGEVLKN